MRKNDIEILAPAGNVDSFKAAVNAGADAVYMGLGKHNARVMAQNFTVEDYIECLNYAHVRGAKVYLTLNTLVMDDEIQEALEMLIKLYEHGLDAVILQDMGLASIIHKLLPDLDMHASTQMSAYSIEQVKFLESLGFKRVVLARELTLKEIKDITDKAECEIEVFMHGALCVSVSGQCLLSLTIGNRSANRGACAQPCRMKYTLMSGNKKIEDSTYILSKKDIFGLDILNDILEANFLSLKIEGRNKTPEYVALVVSLYRKYVDMYKEKGSVTIDPKDEKILLQIFNRNGKSHGYLSGIQYKNSITTLSPKNTGLYLGEVIEQKGKFVKVKVNEEIDLHDGIEIYSKNNVVSNIVTCIKDEKGKIINTKVNSGKIVYIGDINSKVNVKDKIYKTSSRSLNVDISNRYLSKNVRKREQVVNVTIKEDSPITLSTIINNKMELYNTNVIPQKAINKELTLEDINTTFAKTQESGIEFTKAVGFVQKGLFMRVSELNEIRRNFVKWVEEKYYETRDVSGKEKELKEILNSIKYNKIKKYDSHVLNVYSYNKDIDYKDLYYKKYNRKLQRIDFRIADYAKNEKDIFSKYNDIDLGVNISSFVLEKTDKYIRENLERLVKSGVKTLILGSYRYIELAKELKEKYGIKLVADYALNITNSHSAIANLAFGFDVITPSFDSTPEQIVALSKIAPIELVDNYITVMTSRYCILGSFVAGRKEGEACSAPCQKDKYYLKDSYDENYDIVCNNLDCTMQIIRKYNKTKRGLEKIDFSTRNNEI